MRYRNVRKGIEASLSRRSQALTDIRRHFAERMADELDARKLTDARDSVVLAMRMHITMCERILDDIGKYVPRHFNIRTQKFEPLSKAHLAERRRLGTIRAEAHENEAKKSKSRREKMS